MDSYILVLMIIGIAVLSMGWMPAITRKIYVSYAILYVLIGIILYSFPNVLPIPDPRIHNSATLHLAEMVVIISLMGTGIKIDQPFSLKTWKVPFRLVTITMLLCIGAVTILANIFFGFDFPSALLLAAVLAPTDPVLASDVQVGPPLEKNKDNIRFSLTAEAGLNDGMAFPFVWLAILVALMQGDKQISIGYWFWFFLLYKIITGVICGYFMGRLLAFLIFYLPEKRKLVVTRDGFVAVAATLVVYGVTELLSGYGFVAVFITAITLRNYEIGDRYHVRLHDFTDQVEKMLLAIVLILFGGSLASGILDSLTWPLAALGCLFVFVVRPLAGMLSLVGTSLHLKEKLAISFFGIRGIGSFFYLAFAISVSNLFMVEQLWSLLAFIVLLSVVIHGLTASFTMNKLGKDFSQQ